MVDDEEPIRKELIDALNKSLQMEVINEADSVSKAAEIILQDLPDAVFMDIKLRGGDAFQVMDILRKELKYLPAIIINTGYQEFEYAQRVFNQYRDSVITILQKPFWEDWKMKELEIVDLIHEHLGKENTQNQAGNIIIKSDYKTYSLLPEEIIYIETNDDNKNSGKIVLESIDKRIYLNKSLNELIKILPSEFVRVSRFLIINFNYLDYFDHTDHVLYLKGFKRNFGVGQAYEADFFTRLRGRR